MQRLTRLTCSRGPLLACLLMSSLGCARQPLTVTTVEVLTPPPALLLPRPLPPLAGETNADLARGYLECVGVVQALNADKATLQRWAQLSRSK